MQDIQPYLNNFIEPDDDFKTILVIESGEYLFELRQRFPSAEIHAVTSDPEIPKNPSLQNLNINWQILDYRDEPMKFKKEYFDAVISDLTLEVVANPQDIALGISSFIKKTGCFITSFRNIRHWDILKDLMLSKYPGIISRLYCRHGFERILYATFFKEVRFAPVRRKPVKKSDVELFNRLIECGFENPDDLEAEFWLVRAAKSMPELALLKSMYTHELRQQFAFILHRIEYEVDTENNVHRFWKFFRENQMYIDYAALFIHEAVIHRSKFYETLFNYSQQEPELKELLKTANDVEESFH